MANRQASHPAAPRTFAPRGALEEGNLEVRRLTGTAQTIGAEGQIAAANAIAGTLSSLSGKIGSWADEAARQEGAAEGAVAGLDLEFRPRNDRTIRGTAYDQAGISSYLSVLDAQLREDVARVTDANLANPAALRQGLATIDREYRARHVFDEVLPRYQATFERLSLSAMRQSTRAVQARARSEQVAAFETDLDRRLKDLNRNAYHLGLDETADQAVAGELADLDEFLTTAGPDGRRLRSPAEAGRVLRQAELTVAHARISGAFDRLEDVAAKQKFLADFETAYRDGEGPLTVFDLTDFERQRASMERSIAADERRRQRPVRSLNAAINETEAALRDGFLPAEAALEATELEVARTGNAELEAAYERMRAAADFTATARQARPEELAALAERRRAELGAGGVEDARQLDELGLIEGLQRSAEKGLKDDQLGWAERVGIAEIPPIDPASPDFAQQFTARATVADEVAAHYGRRPVYLRASERAALASALDDGDAGQRLAAITAIAEGAGRRANAVFGELGDHAPELAHIGGLVASRASPAVARDALAGLAARKAGVEMPAGGARLKESFTERVGGALTGLAPDDQRAVFEVAAAAYGARALAAGIGEFDETVYGATLDEALGATIIERRLPGGQIRSERAGGLGSWQGLTIVLPPGVSQSMLEGAVSGLEDRDLTRLSASGGRPEHGDGRPASAEDIRAGYLVYTGGASYRVSLSDPKVLPEYLVDGTTGAFYRIGLDADAVAAVTARGLSARGATEALIGTL